MTVVGATDDEGKTVSPYTYWVWLEPTEQHEVLARPGSGREKVERDLYHRLREGMVLPARVTGGLVRLGAGATYNARLCVLLFASLVIVLTVYVRQVIRPSAWHEEDW